METLRAEDLTENSNMLATISTGLHLTQNIVALANVWLYS